MWHVWGKRNACSLVVGYPERRRQLRRLRFGLEDNIKMGRKEIFWEEVD